MFTYEEIESLVRRDCEQFMNGDIISVPNYNYAQHIKFTSNMVYNCILCRNFNHTSDVLDLIHGLNHIFFNGINAGESSERGNNEG